MNKYIIIGSIIVMLGSLGYITSQIKGCKHEEAKIKAIENPDVKKVEVINETIIEEVTADGAKKTTTKRTIGRSRVSRVSDVSNNTSYALIGGYGITFEGQKAYYAGLGYRLTGNLWTEVVYHSVGKDQALTLGLRLEF